MASALRTQSQPLLRHIAVLSRLPTGSAAPLINSTNIFASRCTIETSLESGELDPTASMAAPPLAPAGYSRTFYKRDLPCPPAVAFSSEEGQLIFADALTSGMLQGFFKLIEQFRTQDEPAYCGLASVAMVLNTLAIDPRRAWKGPWRFFHEQMLDCCLPLEKIRHEGITLVQAACLARCNGAAVDVFPYGIVPVDAFRTMVRDTCSSGESHLIVSYSRKAFLQTGDGHFSPIGGYSPSRDMVLILDTARFKYPPHWVRLPELYEAMAAHDPSTGKPRGFMRLQPKPLLESVLFTLDLRDDRNWEAAFKYMHGGGLEAVVAASAAVPGATAKSVITAAALGAPIPALNKFLAVRMTGSCSDTGSVCTQMTAVDTFLWELRGTALYKAVALAVEETATEAEASTLSHKDHTHVNESEISKNQEQPAVTGSLVAERLVMVLLLAPQSVWHDAVTSDTLRKDIATLLDVSTHKVVEHEVQYLKEQYAEVPTIKESMHGAPVNLYP